MRSHEDRQPDLFAGLEAKEEALERVAANSGLWKDEALELMRRVVPVGFVGIGEEINQMLREAGLGEPHHHNAWGALENRAARAGLLRKVPGALRPMQVVSSHARQSLVWERI